MTATPSPRPSGRVLIVEDEAITALDLSTELSGLGYEVCGVVDTAAKALATVDRDRPALVLMDIRLANEDDGIETARQIRDRHDAAVVFLTAHSDEATLARALDVSPFGYLIKPFRARDLKVAVDLAMSKHARDTATTRRLLALASTDALTGLANRRHLDQMLEAEWSRCRRSGRPLAAVMLDVDCFKAFNDAYGHLAGDACLREVAALLRQICGRPGDLPGRWGGEEFFVILPETDRAGAARLAEAMVDGIRALKLPHRRSAVASIVTVSAGVAVVEPGTDQSAGGLLAAADQALYAAKRAGRDRAAFATGSGSQPQ
jgi:diguanylate cyclase (GGDEF)-like protein